jgi:hypothetical protein
VKADEFIREVDEAVRQERWLKLWNQYGTYLVAAVLAIVLGTAAGIGWREYQASARLDEARRFIAAADLLDAGQHEQAAQAFEALAADARSGYRDLARLRAAAARAAAGDAAGRQTALGEVTARGDAADVRQLGRLLVLQSEVDEGAGAADLEPLTRDGVPWRHSAAEMQALAQIRAGQTEAARETLRPLVDDPSAPVNLSRRAAELLAALGEPAAAPVEDAGQDGEAAGAGGEEP